MAENINYFECLHIITHNFYYLSQIYTFLPKIGLCWSIHDGSDDQQQDGTRDHQLHPPCSWDYLLHYAWQQLQR